MSSRLGFRDAWHRMSIFSGDAKDTLEEMSSRCHWVAEHYEDIMRVLVELPERRVAAAPATSVFWSVILGHSTVAGAFHKWDYEWQAAYPDPNDTVVLIANPDGQRWDDPDNTVARNTAEQLNTEFSVNHGIDISPTGNYTVQVGPIPIDTPVLMTQEVAEDGTRQFFFSEPIPLNPTCIGFLAPLRETLGIAP